MENENYGASGTKVASLSFVSAQLTGYQSSIGVGVFQEETLEEAVWNRVIFKENSFIALCYMDKLFAI